MAIEKKPLYNKPKWWLTYLCHTGGTPAKNGQKTPKNVKYDVFFYDPKTLKIAQIEILSRGT